MLLTKYLTGLPHNTVSPGVVSYYLSCRRPNSSSYIGLYTKYDASMVQIKVYTVAH